MKDPYSEEFTEEVVNFVCGTFRVEHQQTAAASVGIAMAYLRSLKILTPAQ